MDKFFLHINEPCQRDWNSMTTNEQGRFCNSCAKNIVDFTGSTKSEITQFFKKSKADEVCGRFYDYQLNTWLDNSGIKRINPRLYKFLMSVMLMAAAQNSSAQDINKTPIEQTAIGTATSKVGMKTKEFTSNCDSSSNAVNQSTRITLGGTRRISADNYPLIVVDGVVLEHRDLTKLNLDDIKTVNILSSKSSTAIYGPEGVNGAVIIKTKACSQKSSVMIPNS